MIESRPIMGASQSTSPIIRRAPIPSGRSPEQERISLALLSKAAQLLAQFRLSETQRYEDIAVHPEVLELLQAVNMHREGWAFEYVKDEKKCVGHLARSLLPVDWDALDDKSSLRKIAAHSNLTLSRKLLSIAFRTLKKDLPEDPKSLFDEYGKWLQGLIEQAHSACESVLSPLDKIDDEKLRAKKEYVAWALVNAVGIQLHKICDFAENQGHIREGATVLHELYRYRDTVHVESIEAAGLLYDEKKLEVQTAGPTRDFQGFLYDGTLALDGVASDYKAAQNGDTREATSASYDFSKLLTPKNRALVRYVRRKLKSSTPPAIVIVAHTQTHAKYIFDLLRQSRGVSERAGMLLLSGSSATDRKNAMLHLENNEVSFVVTTELGSVPKGVINKECVICSLTHHRKPFKQYPWVAELVGNGMPPLVAAFSTRGSSDSGRRAGAARKRKGTARATDGFKDEDLRQLLLFEDIDRLDAVLTSDAVVRRQVSRLFGNWNRFLDVLRAAGGVSSADFKDFLTEQVAPLRLLSYSGSRPKAPKGLRQDLNSLFSLQFEQVRVFLDPSVIEEIGIASALKQWGTAFRAVWGDFKLAAPSSKFGRILGYAAIEAFVKHLEDVINEDGGLDGKTPTQKLRTIFCNDQCFGLLDGQIKKSKAWLVEAFNQTNHTAMTNRARQGQQSALKRLSERLSFFE